MPTEEYAYEQCQVFEWGLISWEELLWSLGGLRGMAITLFPECAQEWGV
jgi:hypothetical protein